MVLDQQASNLTPTYVYSCATRRDKKCFGRQPGSIWGGLTCGGGSRHFSTLKQTMKVFQELFCNHVGCRQKIGISQAERGIQERGKNIERKPGSAQPSSKIGMGPREMRVKPGGCAVRRLIPCPHHRICRSCPGSRRCQVVQTFRFLKLFWARSSSTFG